MREEGQRTAPSKNRVLCVMLVGRCEHGLFALSACGLARLVCLRSFFCWDCRAPSGVQSRVRRLGRLCLKTNVRHALVCTFSKADCRGRPKKICVCVCSYGWLKFLVAKSRLCTFPCVAYWLYHHCLRQVCNVRIAGSVLFAFLATRWQKESATNTLANACVFLERFCDFILGSFDPLFECSNPNTNVHREYSPVTTNPLSPTLQFRSAAKSSTASHLQANRDLFSAGSGKAGSAAVTGKCDCPVQGGNVDALVAEAQLQCILFRCFASSQLDIVNTRLQTVPSLHTHRLLIFTCTKPRAPVGTSVKISIPMPMLFLSEHPARAPSLYKRFGSCALEGYPTASSTAPPPGGTTAGRNDAAAAAAATAAAFSCLAFLHCRLLFLQAAPLLFERAFRPPPLRPSSPPKSVALASLSRSPAPSTPSLAAPLPPPPLQPHRLGGALHGSCRTSMIPRFVRLRPERKDGRTQSMPRMALLPPRPPPPPPLPLFCLASSGSPRGWCWSVSLCRSRMRGMDGLRTCRGAEAALITAARSKPHREITNCSGNKKKMSEAGFTATAEACR